MTAIGRMILTPIRVVEHKITQVMTWKRTFSIQEVENETETNTLPSTNCTVTIATQMLHPSTPQKQSPLKWN